MTRKSITIILFFLLLPIFAFGQVQWSSPITFGQGLMPDFSIDAARGELHIVYHVSGQGVMYVKTDADGQILTGPELVPYTDGSGQSGLADDGNGGWDFGAAIEVDSNGYPHICYRVPLGDNYFDLKYIRQTMTGWSAPLQLASNIRRGYVVRMAIDSEDRIHIGQSKAGDTIWGHVQYFRLQNGQKQKDYQLTENGRQEFRVDNRFEVTVSSDDAVHFIIACPGLDGEPNIGPVTYYRSTNHGDSFARIADIHNRTECISRNAAPDICADTTGALHIVYGAKKDASIEDNPSLRYVRYENNGLTIDDAITDAGELTHWNHKDYGLGSIACSEDGNYLISAYLNACEEDLFVRQSDDGGQNWTDPEELASGIGTAEGRNMHLIRSWKNNFYVIYPENGTRPYVHMRILRHIGDLDPAAASGGPYQASEGDSVTFDASASTDFGQNSGLVLYEWDIDNDGLYDLESEQPIIKHYFDDDFQSTAVLRVTDRVGKQDTSQTTISISNVTPSVSIGADIDIKEGDLIEISSQVSDPGNDVITYAWTLGDGAAYTSENISHLFDDDGMYHVTLNISDDDGGTAQDILYVNSVNVNPVAVIEGSYDAGIMTPITFTGSGTDAGPADQDQLAFAWDFDNDGLFETAGAEAVHDFDSTGTYTVWFRVMDDDGGRDSVSTTVSIRNDPTVLADAPDQIIREGETFSPLNLNDLIEESDQPANQLIWTMRGGSHLTFNLNNHTLSAAAPSTDWFGSDSLYVHVTDPGHLIDSVLVHFIVEPVNDAPYWHDVPDFTFNEDDTLHLTYQALYDLIVDIDNAPEDFTFDFSRTSQIHWVHNREKERFDFIPQTNWSGSEIILFTVRDTDNAAATDTCLMTVRPVNDMPNAFTIIDPVYLKFEAWPDSLVFLWEAATDPDEGDEISYEWTLKRQGNLAPITRTAKTLELTYTFHADADLEEGTYFWWIHAMDQSGGSRRSSREGIIIVGDPTIVNVEDMAKIPDKFDLLPAFPNPFNPATTLTFLMPEPAQARVCVYNLTGQMIRTLVHEIKPAGIYRLQWDGTDTRGNQAPSGIYLIQFVSGRHHFLQKISLIR